MYLTKTRIFPIEISKSRMKGGSATKFRDFKGSKNGVQGKIVISQFDSTLVYVEDIMKKLLSSLGIAGMVAFGWASGAQAVSITSSMHFGELNLLSDNSAEYLLNSDGTTADTGDTFVDVGDRLIGHFNVGTIEDLTGGGGVNPVGTSGVNELTGIFDITAVTKVAVAGGGFDWTFAPTPAASSIFTLLGVPQPAGTMVAMFEDATPDYTRLFNDPNFTVLGPDDGAAASENAIMGSSINGSEFWTFGFLGLDADEIWTAFAIDDDISVIGATNPPGNGGTANFALSLIADPLDIGPNIAPVGTTVAIDDGLILGLNGSGNLLGLAGADTPFDNFDNFDFAVRPIPEPGTVVLLGLGFLGLAAMGRKKMRK